VSIGEGFDLVGFLTAVATHHLLGICPLKENTSKANASTRAVQPGNVVEAGRERERERVRREEG
jgi:hypothetical protein